MYMFRALGIVIVLYAVTQLMSSTFQAFEEAAVATLETIEVAAAVTQERMIELR